MTHNIKSLKPSKRSRYQQGYINPESCKKLFPELKYEKIIYRSSYEKKFLVWLETNNQIKNWGSECISIKYFSALDNKYHTYYPDYFVVLENGEKWVIEIKPYNQTIKPINENQRNYKEYIKNICKWREAEKFCKANGYKFKILTEKTIDKLS